MGEGDLLGFVLELERLDPAPPRMRPGPALVGLAQTATKQVFHQPVLGATLVDLRGRTLADEISQSLVLGGGDPDRREVAGLVRLGELLGIAAIGLHLVAGLLGNERRCDDLAVDAELGELPVEGVARRSGLVANLETLAAAELFDELAHRFGTVGELAEATDLPTPFGNGRRDGFSVNIET